MTCNYSWARRTIRKDHWTIGELADGLQLGRHRTRRILVASKLPYKVIKRHWWYGQRGFTRKVISIPEETVLMLYIERTRDQWKPLAKFDPSFVRESIQKLDATIAHLRSHLTPSGWPSSPQK